MHSAIMKNSDHNGTTNRQPHVATQVGIVVLVALFLAGLLAFRAAPFGAPPPTVNSVATTSANGAGAHAGVLQAQQVNYRVVNSFPHDRRAFLQGLLWHDGYLYESTGLEGQSTLRRVDLTTGRVLQLVKLPANVFGEGLALANNRLFQISWQSQRAFVYDRATFKLLNEWSYEGEGWGITYDGKQLIMSDGSDVLTFRDPQTFAPTRKINVTLNGRSLNQLNELEWIDGEVWANVWQTDLIVRIDPETGQVKSFLDLTGLLPRNLRTGKEDVLNGIAYDKTQHRIFISGKLWPRLFEITVGS